MMLSDLVTFLENDAGISALIGTRIYPQILPQDPTFPAITYSQTSGVRDRVIREGPSGRARPRITINCWGERYSQARALADAVRIALDGYRGIMGSTDVGGVRLDNEFDLFEEEAGIKGIHRTIQDFIISFVEGA